MFGRLVGEKKDGENIYKTKGRGLPLRLIASAVVPFLGEVAKPTLKKIFSGRRLGQ